MKKRFFQDVSLIMLNNRYHYEYCLMIKLKCLKRGFSHKITEKQQHDDYELRDTSKPGIDMKKMFFYEMHKEFQILKVNDIVEYKLSKLIHSLLSDTPKLPETLDKLIVNWILYTPELQETNIKFTVKKKTGQSENDN